MRVQVILLMVSYLCPLGYYVEATGVIIGDCYEKWGDCSGWSTWGKPNFKLLCEDGCKALGKFGGVCILSNKNCPKSKPFQCQCSTYCYRSDR